MKTITLSIYRLIPAICLSLVLSFSGFAQVPDMPATAGATSNDIADPCYGYEVVDYKPGPGVPNDRAIPGRALGEPDRANEAGGFVSLGPDGEITIKFDGVVYDMPNYEELQVWETTFSGDNCSGANDEYADVSVSKNDVDYFSIGNICRDGDPLDIGVSGLDFIRYVKITDTSNGNGFGADKSFDLDGIEALNGCSEDPGDEPNPDLCQNYNAFYAHNGAGNASSLIFGLEFQPGIADFSDLPLIDMGEYGNSYRVHISYDEAANVIYTARNDGSEIISFSFNPGNSKWEQLNRFDLDGVPNGVVQNVFYQGRVYLGSSSSNDLYEVNPLNGDVQHWEISGLNINGGDLVVKDGVFYSASRSGRNIYEITFNNDGTFTGSATVINNGQGTPAQVNGIALSAAGNFIMANDGKTEVYELDNLGAEIAAYAIDAPFDRLLDGDLASGCADGGGEEPQEPCDNYKAFYVDHNGGDSNLYRVSLDDGALTAGLELITTLPYSAHITLNTDDGYVYAVNEDSKQIDKINPNDGNIEESIILKDDGPAINSIYCMAYNAGRIYLASANKDMIYEVDPSTGDYTVIATEVPVEGGDLIFRGGRLFLASRTGQSTLYLISGGPNSETEWAEMPSKVNGLALNASEEFISTHFGKSMIYRYSGDGSELDPYATDGFQFKNGDLASGCTDADPEPAGCESYVAYGSNFGPGEDSVIYGIEFDSENTAVTTRIATRPYKAHVTFNPDDGYIYSVNEDGNIIEKISPVDGTSVAIDLIKGDAGQPDLNKVINMVYYNGKIYLGDQNKDLVLEVEFVGGDAAYSVYASNVPVSGGDLVWRDDVLYLATRSGNRILEIDGSGVVSEVTNQLENKVTGIALSEDNNFIVSNDGQTSLFEYDIDGNQVAEYALSGDVVDLFSGDLASGCADNGGGESLCDIAAIANPGAEAASQATGNDFENGWEQYSAGEEPAWLGWSTTTSIEVQESGRINGNVSFCGDYHFELLSRAIGDNMYQVIDTNPGSTVYVSFYHKKRQNNDITNVMEVMAGDFASFNNDGNNLNKIAESSVEFDEGWKFVQVSFEATSEQTVVMLRGLSGTTVSIGNLIDDVYIGCEAQEEREPCSEQEVPSLVPHEGAYSNQIVDASRVSIYPVPTVNELSIKVDNSGTMVQGTYYITSINGRTTHQGTVDIINGESSVITENVSSLPAGMYFLVMELNGRQITKQFVKTAR